VREEIKVSNYLLLDGKEKDGMTPYEAFLGFTDDPHLAIEEQVSLDDPHMILYTSGTTGYPKGAIQTHGNILFNSINANIALDIVSSDVTLCALPLFHVGGLHVMTTPTLHAGGTVVIQRAFDAGEALQLIHDKKVNTIFLVSTMWQFMCQHEAFEETDLSGLRLAWTGGAPCPLHVIKAYQEKGVLFRQGYGLTEVGPDAMILAAEDAVRKIGSIGKPPFHAAMRVVDEDGVDVSLGEVGELIFLGPTVTPGYWNKPEATAEALRDGWFHTGDLAKIDDEGYVFIVDRKKDMFISGGENVYPVQIENVLYQNPKVAEAAVFGVPDEKWGEVGHAVICPKSGVTLTEEEIISFLKDKLARFKIPKSVSFMNTLPKNPAGKVLKRVLREPYWKDLDKQVH
jgi:fatty-acyl-CoA synthase